MKNVLIAAVFSLGTMTAFAQEETAVEETATDNTEMATEGADEATQVADDAAESTEAAAEDVASGEDFSEVTTDELPEAVTAAVSKNYPTASIDKAYVNEANQFKLEVSLEDGTAGTLYADENGNWIEM